MFLGLGSNSGSSTDILKAALGELSRYITQLSSSSLYSSSPRYVLDQPDFLNLVTTGLTELPPFDLLKHTQEIEAAFGRDRSRERPKGERTLDIDILLYGSTTMDTDRLRLPHPGILERAFVLVPLNELAPDLINHVSGKPFAEALNGVKDQGIYLHDKVVL